jgi:hypothetical protein
MAVSLVLRGPDGTYTIDPSRERSWEQDRGRLQANLGLLQGKFAKVFQGNRRLEFVYVQDEMATVENLLFHPFLLEYVLEDE